MISFADFEPWWRFGFALLIGALIGLEREFYQQKRDSPDFAGLRTFSLIALLGSVSTFLASEFGTALAVLALGGLILMVTVSYHGAIVRSKAERGITTEVAAILTFLFGVLVMGDHALVAIALAVITSLLLAFKVQLHQIVREMDVEDIHATLQFAIVAAVILPLLPNRTIDPFGLINPFQIWLMVVLVSGIGFIGYVLMHIFGPTKGINLMGIFGGLASSTATTISFASASREHPQMAQHYSRAVVLASTVMFPRILILILAIHPPLVLEVLIPLLLMLATGILIIFGARKEGPSQDDTIHPEFEITNPLKLMTAIKFGLLFALVLVVVEFAQSFLGSSGVYLASFLTGLTDVDAITLSVSRLTDNAEISMNVAGAAVLIAAITNTFTKGVITFSSGSQEFKGFVIKAFAWMIAVGIVSGVLTIYVF